jgi:predicted acetylornithine/succinylornithine family transaminase
MDFFAGIAVNALGYSHPKIIEAVTNQISKYSHLSNYFISDIQVKLAKKLLELSGMDKIFFTNSGTEATEAVLKLVRKYSGPDKTIFSLTNNFHGRSYGALSLSSRDKYKKSFEPLLNNFKVIEFNNINDLKNNIDQNCAAVFVEFIQGEGGIYELSNEFAEELNNLRKEFGFLIIADEVQSGIGRTGKAFAYNYYTLEPDVVLVAKSIGGGIPLGAMMVKHNFSNVFSQGEHGTTFGGNPVACAAGLALLKVVFDEGLVQRVYDLGDYLKSQLVKIQKKYSTKLVDVRGKGFMIGVELSFPGQIVVDEMFKRKILVNCTNTNVLRLVPPLITTKDQIDHFLINLDEVIQEINP